MKPKVTLCMLMLLFGFTAQAQPTVSLTYNNASLLTVFNEVKQQTGYDFVYASELMKNARPVSVQLTRRPLTDVLDACFRDQPFSYTFSGKTVILRARLVVPLPVLAHGDTALITINGKVTGKAGEPLAGAIVSISRSSRQVRAGSNGDFTLGGLHTDDSLIISHAGYLSKSFAASNGGSHTFVLERGQQSPKTVHLKEVVVQAPQDALEMRGGNLIFNVTRSITAQGLNALELLKKLPGVDVDDEASIGLNGNKGVLIYLDGKQTYLSTKEVIDLLRTIPSSQLKTIELISTPGAKYDAEGAAGIINLTTNKNQQKGLTATLSAGVAYGISAKQQADANVTYRKNKLTVYGGYNHILGNYNYVYGSDRLQSGTQFDSYTDDVDKRQKLNARLGADYQLSPKSTLGWLTTGNFVLGGGITDTHTQFSDPATGSLQQTLWAINDYYYQQTRRFNHNLNYRYDNQKGRSLSIDVDLGRFRKSNKNLQNNTYLSPQNSILDANLYRTLNDIDIKLYGAKVDYAAPLWNGKLELGAKQSEVNSDNNSRFYHVLATGDSLDNRRSNRFDYRERLTAAYLSYGKKLGKLSFDAGLRYEHTRSAGVLRFRDVSGAETTQDIGQRYGNFFPFVNVSVKHLSLSYAKRISRPAYQTLNPFVYLLDELSFWQGNPFLQPQSTHRVALQYDWRGSTFITLSYSHTNNFSASVTDTLGQNKIVMITKNLGLQQNLSLNVAQNLHPAAWLDLSLNGLVYYLHNNINTPDFASLNLSQWAARLNGTATLKLPWKLTGEVTGAYNTRRLGGANIITKANSRVDVGLQKVFNKATLRLALTDVYKGSTLYSTQNFAGFEYSNFGYYEARQVRLSFTYKIVNGKVDGRKQRESALDKENERTGN